jgi:septum formation topological specificity factor MinE
LSRKIIKSIATAKISIEDNRRAREEIGHWKDKMPEMRSDIRQVIRTMVKVETETVRIQQEMEGALARLLETGEIESDLLDTLGDSALISENWRIPSAADPVLISEILANAERVALQDSIRSMSEPDAIRALSELLNGMPDTILVKMINQANPNKQEIIRQWLSTK